MFFWKNIFFLFISFIFKRILNIRTHQYNLVNTTNNISHPLIYLMLTNSKLYLILLYIQCRKYHLPNPLDNISINNNKKIPRFFCIKEKHNCFKYMYCGKNINKFNDYLNLIINYYSNITIILVTIISSKKKLFFYNSSYFFVNNLFNFFIKIINFLWIKKDIIIYFSHPLSSLHIYNKLNSITLNNTNKILRIVSIYFIRQKKIIVGSNDLYTSVGIITSNIKNHIKISKTRKLSFSEKDIIKLFKEISSNFSYEAFNLCNNLFQFLFKRIHNALKAYNINRVKLIAEKRHKIIYIPCHRSHMDYIIISYILYHNLLLPPFIAAGINLNFWLVGNIARLLGAFFIRRNFKNNKLYSIIFRDYFNQLLNNDSTIEYFIEGSRSRTGKLLTPKTGLLSIIIKYVLNNIHKPVTIIPINISYTKIIEIDYYDAEINNSINKKWYILFLFEQMKNIYNLDTVHINFGQPININEIIKKTYYSKTNKKCITPLANNIAYNIMNKINSAVVINVSNLCLTILLDSNNYTLTRIKLFKQLLCYLNLLNCISYLPDMIIRNYDNKRYWLKNFLKSNKNIIYDNNTHLVSLVKDNIYNIKYYKNSIQHVLILPALIASIIYANSSIKKIQLIYLINYIYPIVKLDFFISIHKLELKLLVNKIINEFVRQHLLLYNNDKLFLTKHYQVIKILAKSIYKVLLRYVIICILLIDNIELKFTNLVNNWDIIQNKLNITQDMCYIFDNVSFNNIVLIFRSVCGCKNNNINTIKINRLYNIFKRLILKINF
ncbi:MAG: 1-acyl-sn-glycerol-3-phosphate acyltransferase [Candidatus Lightella neohaematopini]|nr:1-acyl-sn-glycerol-3-phosphate acyltransferase [Candidatus Lightella neohaematopini]